MKKIIITISTVFFVLLLITGSLLAEISQTSRGPVFFTKLFANIYLDANNTLWFWSNKMGNVYFPTKPTVYLKDVVTASLDDRFATALKKDGSLWVWGFNDKGQCALDDNIRFQKEPIKILDDIIDVSSFNNLSVALKKDGTVCYWGSLYNNSATLKKNITLIEEFTNIKKVWAGDNFIMALKEDNTLWGWGYSDYALAPANNYQPINSETPLLIMNDVKKVAIADDYLIVLKTNGTVWGWGKEYSGQLQLNDVPLPDSFSYEPLLLFKGAKDIAAGVSHVIALKNNGTVWAWGNAEWGALGIGYVPLNSAGAMKFAIRVLAKPAKINNVKAIYATDGSSFALKEDGTVWTWGMDIINPPTEPSEYKTNWEPVPFKWPYKNN